MDFIVVSFLFVDWTKTMELTIQTTNQRHRCRPIPQQPGIQKEKHWVCGRARKENAPTVLVCVRIYLSCRHDASDGNDRNVVLFKTRTCCSFERPGKDVDEVALESEILALYCWKTQRSETNLFELWKSWLAKHKIIEYQTPLS